MPALSLIICPRGGGKTTLAKEILDGTDRFIIYDPHREYLGRAFDAVPISTFNDLLYLLKRNEQRIIFKPSKWDREIFEYFSAVVYHKGKDYLIAIEEANRFYPANIKMRWSTNLVDNGRHSGHGMLAMCRRPLGMDKDFMANCNNYFIGNTFLQSDLNFYEGFLPSETITTIAQLKKFEFLYWNLEARQSQKVSSMLQILP